MSNLTIARLAVYAALVLAVAMKAWTGSLLPLLVFSSWAGGLWLMGLLVIRERAPRRDLPKGSGTSLNSRWRRT